MSVQTLWAELSVSSFSKWFATETEARAYRHDRPHQHRAEFTSMRYLDPQRDAEKWARGQRYEHGYRVYLEFWQPFVTMYLDGDWKSSIKVPCSVTRGDTNWDRVYRYDVRFTHPTDGWDWYGKLITGGDNCTFKVRRTATTSLFRTSQCGNPCKHVVIVPAEAPGYLRVTSHKTGQELVATLHNGKWLSGASVADVVTQILCA